MRAVMTSAHLAVTRVYAHPVTKPTLTHTGVAGFAFELVHATLETLAHFVPAALTAVPLLVNWNEAYLPWRDLTLAYAALALGLVLYCDNAHHVLAALCGEKPQGDNDD